MRQLRHVVFVGFVGVVLAGCIEHQLVPCGDKFCASGTTCVANRCASGDQLIACDGKGDGASCSVNAAVGICDSGVCVAVGCGNDIMDADEVCDDGNTDYGDGCSGDCRSLESCGNGIVDFAKGESCDCASDAANKPAQCRFANSEDADAECSTSCQLRYCGDSTINALEQCDGLQVGASSCADFGYYRGSLSCSSLCRHDASTCDGRCGDDIVDAAFGEYCDGGAPVGTCLDFAFDAGSISCSTACSPNVEACEQFGWKKIDSSSVLSVWARDSFQVVVSSSGGAYVLINGIHVNAPTATYSLATGAGTTGFAVGASLIAVWSSNTWSTIPTGWTSGTPTSAIAHPTLGLFVVVNGEVWRYAQGAWSLTAEVSKLGVTASDDFVFAWNSSSIRAFDGTTWSSFAVGGVSNLTLVVGGGTTLWAEVNEISWRRTSTTSPQWTAVTALAIDHAAVAPNGDLLASLSTTGAVRRVTATGGIDALNTAVLTGSRVAVDNDGGFVLAGGNGIFRLRTGAWINVEVDNGYNQYQDNSIGSLTVSPDGNRVVIGYWGAWAGDGGSYFPVIDSDPTGQFAVDGAIDDVGQTVLATGNGVWLAYNGWLIELADPDNTSLGTMTVGPDGEVVAAGNGVVARNMHPTSGWRQIDVPGYNITRVRRGDGKPIFALTTTYQIIVIDEDAQTLVTELPYPQNGSGQIPVLLDFFVPGDDEIIAISDRDLYHYQSGQWTRTPIPGIVARAVSGTSSTDVFVGGTLPAFTSGSPLLRWNGSTFTPVRLAQTAPHVVGLHVTERAITMTGGGREVFDIIRAASW